MNLAVTSVQTTTFLTRVIAQTQASATMNAAASMMMNAENLSAMANSSMSSEGSTIGMDAVPSVTASETPSLAMSPRRERPSRQRMNSDLNGMMAMMNMAPTPYSSPPVIPTIGSIKTRPSDAETQDAISAARRLRRMKRRLLLESVGDYAHHFELAVQQNHHRDRMDSWASEMSQS
jgi:hypothetical protein